jgi:hypothetical protein
MPRAAAKRMAWTALEDNRMSMRRLANFVSKHTEDPKPSLLGVPHAIVIVCGAARTDPTNLERTLEELGRDGESFQRDVYSGVTKAGYYIEIDSIEHSGDTALSDVVVDIQSSPQS